MTTCQTFPAFLQERAIFSQPQAEKLQDSLSNDDENQRVFLLADFFRSLTPSDCYDLALRLCSSYKKASKETPIINLSTQPKSPVQQRSPHFLPKKFNNNTHFSPKSVPTSPGSKRRIGSNSPDRSDLKTSINYDPSTGKKGGYNHLYEESKLREYSRVENENKKYIDEVRDCTFQPNATKMTTPNKNNSRVFERLQQEGFIKKEKEEINNHIKKQMEVKECTFKPKILSNSMKVSFDDRNTSRASISTQDKTFDRLYKDYQTKQHAFLENEFKKKSDEVKNCTFKPALTARNSSSGNENMSERFNRLYELHGKKQRTLLNKQIERSEDEDRHCTFKPQILATATPINSGKEVHDRLLEWHDSKKRKLNEKIVEKAVGEEAMHKDAYLPAKRRNEGTDRGRTSQSPYDRLYQSQEAKRAKKEQLEKKVMKDIGASFTPSTNSKRGHSASKSSSSSNKHNLLLSFPESKLNSPRDTLTQRRSSPTPQYLPRRQSEKNIATAWNYKINGFQSSRNNTVYTGTGKGSPDSKSRVATFGLC